MRIPVSSELAQCLARMGHLAQLRFYDAAVSHVPVIDLPGAGSLKTRPETHYAWTFRGDLDADDSLRVILSCHDPDVRGLLHLRIDRFAAGLNHAWSFSSLDSAVAREEIKSGHRSTERRLTNPEKVKIRYAVGRLLHSEAHFQSGALESSDQLLRAKRRLLSWICP